MTQVTQVHVLVLTNEFNAAKVMVFDDREPWAAAYKYYSEHPDRQWEVHDMPARNLTTHIRSDFHIPPYPWCMNPGECAGSCPRNPSCGD